MKKLLISKREPLLTVVLCALLLIGVVSSISMVAEALEPAPQRNVHRFFYRYDDDKGFSHLKTLFPPIVITTREAHNKKPLRTLAAGDVLICEEYQRVSKVVNFGGEPVVVHEMVLDCNNGKGKKVGHFVIKGMNFRGD